MQEKQFKVGDRVVYVGEEIISEDVDKLLGTIVDIDVTDDARPYLVNFDTKIFEFDTDINGHTGGGKCPDCHGWWVRADEVKLTDPSTFKVGDRVECVVDYSYLPKGSKGTVLIVDSDGSIGVEWDDFDGGHAFCGRVDGCKDGHGWWLNADNLILTKEDKEALFKVGDRVENVGSIYVPYASEGTVCLVEGNSIGVDWDDFTEGHNFCDRVKCRDNHGWWVDAADISLISCTGKSLKAYCSSNPHYETALQPIEFMQANMTHEEFVGFLKGNIIKYTARCGKKDDVDKEVAKIVEYAKWLAKAYKGETINPRES